MPCEFIVLRLQARPEIAQRPIGEGGLGHPGCVSIPPRCGILLGAGVSRDRRRLRVPKDDQGLARSLSRARDALASRPPAAPPPPPPPPPPHPPPPPPPPP